MRAQPTSLFTQLLSSGAPKPVLGLCFLLSLCFTSTETVWFVGGGGVAVGVGGEEKESPGHLPLHAAPELWAPKPVLGLCLLLSLCFASTETAWFVWDEVRWRVGGGGGEGLGWGGGRGGLGEGARQ